VPLGVIVFDGVVVPDTVLERVKVPVVEELPVLERVFVCVAV